MTQDQSGHLSPPDGAALAFSGPVEAENEPFLMPSDLATARRPRILDGNADGNEGRRERSAGRPRRARGDAAVRARLLHALPPRLSQWLHASTQDDDPEPPRDRHGRAPPTLRVPVTLRALPGHASRPASLHEIRANTHRRIREDEDEDEDEDALPALVSLTDVAPPLTRRVGSAESLSTPQQQQQHEHVHASPAGSPRSSASSDDASQSEEMSTLDEFHTLFRRCHHTLPFVALFVLYFVYQHIAGLAMFALGSVAVGGLDTRLRAQIALKENANRLYLAGIAAICGVDAIVISSLDGEPNPFRHLTFKLHAASTEDATTKAPPHSGALILELLWIVLVNDFIVRFWSLAIKALVAAVRPDGVLFALRRSCSGRGRSDSGVSHGSPDLDLEEGQRRKLTRSNVAFYRRKRKLYGIIELTSIFFRSLIAGLPWCSFYQLGSSKFMADVFTFLYVFGKSVILGSQGRRLIKLVRSFLTLGLEHATYVTRDELAEAGCPDCSICYETMHTPVKLSCSHLFCEECVMEWFDRERSCPLCRAAIVPAAQADSEPKPQFLDGSTSLFPQLF